MHSQVGNGRNEFQPHADVRSVSGVRQHSRTARMDAFGAER